MKLTFSFLLLFSIAGCVPGPRGGKHVEDLEKFRQFKDDWPKARGNILEVADVDKYLFGDLQLGKRARIVNKYLAPKQKSHPKHDEAAVYLNNNIIRIVESEFVKDVLFLSKDALEAHEAAVLIDNSVSIISHWTTTLSELRDEHQNGWPGWLQREGRAVDMALDLLEEYAEQYEEIGFRLTQENSDADPEIEREYVSRTAYSVTKIIPELGDWLRGSLPFSLRKYFEELAAKKEIKNQDWVDITQRLRRKKRALHQRTNLLPDRRELEAALEKEKGSEIFKQHLDAFLERASCKNFVLYTLYNAMSQTLEHLMNASLGNPTRQTMKELGLVPERYLTQVSEKEKEKEIVEVKAKMKGKGAHNYHGSLSQGLKKTLGVTRAREMAAKRLSFPGSGRASRLAILARRNGQEGAIAEAETGNPDVNTFAAEDFDPGTHVIGTGAPEDAEESSKPSFTAGQILPFPSYLLELGMQFAPHISFHHTSTMETEKHPLISIKGFDNSDLGKRSLFHFVDLRRTSAKNNIAEEDLKNLEDDELMDGFSSQPSQLYGEYPERRAEMESSSFEPNLEKRIKTTPSTTAAREDSDRDENVVLRPGDQNNAR